MGPGEEAEQMSKVSPCLEKAGQKDTNHGRKSEVWRVKRTTTAETRIYHSKQDLMSKQGKVPETSQYVRMA